MPVPADLKEKPHAVAQKIVYVSITGLELKAARHAPWFWWHAVRAMKQAHSAPGNLRAETRTINAVHHTLSVWTDEAAMRSYLVSGAHKAAMQVFPAIATGKTFGFPTTDVPDWDQVHALWHAHGVEK